jgi:hypothetical protein
MLLALRDFILREKVVSTQQLTRAFKVELSALQPMLDCWVQKGVIEAEKQASTCQRACRKCHTSLIYYRICSSRVDL